MAIVSALNFKKNIYFDIDFISENFRKTNICLCLLFLAIVLKRSFALFPRIYGSDHYNFFHFYILV